MSAVLALDAFEQTSSPAFQPTRKASVPSPSPAVVYRAMKSRRLRVVETLVKLAEDPEALGRLPRRLTQERLQILFDLLPDDMPDGDPYVSHVGSISFDWDENPSSSLSLMVQADGHLGYAAYFDGVRACGVIPLESSEFRSKILPLLQEWRRGLTRIAR